MQTVQCEKCQEVFELQAKERQHENGIIEVYLQCPKCQDEAIAYVTDAWARQEQHEVRKLRERYYKRKDKLSQHMGKLKQDVLDKKEDEQKASE